MKRLQKIIQTLKRKGTPNQEASEVEDSISQLGEAQLKEGAEAKDVLRWFGKNLTLVDRLAGFLATAGGAGLAPFAPGTAGTVIGLLLFMLIPSWKIQLVVFSSLTVLGWWASMHAQKHSGKKDDQRIVIDECAGIWISLLFFAPTPVYLVSGFLLFRVLDIVKIFPADWCEKKFPNAHGVMLDDIVSGVYVQMLLRIGSKALRLL